jgi:transposase
MGRLRRVPEGLGAAVESARRLEGHQLEGGDRRRDVFPGKKRGAEVGLTKKGKGTKIMLLVDGRGTPLAAEMASASQGEVNLIEPLLDNRTSRRCPKRLLYDRAADSDPLRKRLAARRIELVCPHRKNRTRPKTQNGRKLRRYKRRWKVERSISWLFNCRRLVVRYEYWNHLFAGFLQLACLFTILKRF